MFSVGKKPSFTYIIEESMFNRLIKNQIVEISIEGIINVNLAFSCNLIDSLKSYLNILNHEWISVKDKLPENGANVLICDDKNNISIGIYGKTLYGYSCFINNSDKSSGSPSITHWMHLPSGPNK